MLISKDTTFSKKSLKLSDKMSFKVSLNLVSMRQPYITFVN